MAASTPAGLAWIASRDSDTPWQYPDHLNYLNRKLLEVASGRTRRLMVFMPPGHAKSSLISEAFPAWYLMTHPEHQVILASYGAEFAASWGRKARDLVAKYGPAIYGVQVRDDSSAAHRWQIAKHRGVMNTAGAGGDVTGKRGDLFVIDDPIKNYEEAMSALQRQNLYDWYKSVAYTRLTPNGRMVLVMTRWHHDDLAGRLLDDMKKGGDQWDVVSLPAFAEEGDPLGRQPGDALWPEMWGKQRLEETRREVGAQKWVSMYQQRPTPEAGATFKREYFSQRWRELPNLEPGAKIITVDSAFKDGVGNDYSVIATWGRANTGRVGYYLIDEVHIRAEMPELLAAIVAAFQKHKPSAVLIEDAASGQSAIQTLRRGVPTTDDPNGPKLIIPVIPVKPVGSKQSRADDVSPLLQAGLVFIPEEGDWVGDYVEEMVGFPKAGHDDRVDTSSMALKYLRDSGAGVQVMESVFDMASPSGLLDYQPSSWGIQSDW